MRKRVDSNYTFYTDKLVFNIESKSNSKEHYITGYISTEDKDLYNDMVTRDCMENMLVQIKSGNVKLDIDHEAYKKGGDSKIIPIGKIIDAKVSDF